MSFETATPTETQAPFDPVLCRLLAGDADQAKLAPPGLSADRQGILYAHYGGFWLSLNNAGGKSKIETLEKNLVRIAGTYNFSHFGQTGNGTFSYQAKLLPNGKCEVTVKITGKLQFDLHQAGTYVANEEHRFVHYSLADGTGIRQQGHGSNLLWYPHYKIDIQASDKLYQLAWENRPV